MTSRHSGLNLSFSDQVCGKKDGFESSRDRHENLGKGQIPKAELEYVIKNCKTDIVVETPGGLEAQKKDIAWIKRRMNK